jgi:hypothetical protein
MEKVWEKIEDVKIWKDTEDSLVVIDDEENSWDENFEEFFEKCLNRLIFTLRTKGIQFSKVSDKAENLMYLVSLISQEYKKLQQKRLEKENIGLLQYETISLLKCKGSNILTKIFEKPTESLTFSKQKCKKLRGILIGVLRDSSCIWLEEKNKKLNQNILIAEKNMTTVNWELSDKNNEIEKLKKELKEMQYKIL